MGPFCRLYDVISDKGQLSNGIKGARIWIPSRHGKGGMYYREHYKDYYREYYRAY